MENFYFKKVLSINFEKTIFFSLKKVIKQKSFENKSSPRGKMIWHQHKIEEINLGLIYRLQ